MYKSSGEHRLYISKLYISLARPRVSKSFCILVMTLIQQEVLHFGSLGNSWKGPTIVKKPR